LHGTEPANVFHSEFARVPKEFIGNRSALRESKKRKRKGKKRKKEKEKRPEKKAN